MGRTLLRRPGALPELLHVSPHSLRRLHGDEFFGISGELSAPV
jgi:hypothetical protein